MLLSSPVDMASNPGLGKEAQIWSHILVPRFRPVTQICSCTGFESLPKESGAAGDSNFHSLLGEMTLQTQNVVHISVAVMK